MLEDFIDKSIRELVAADELRIRNIVCAVFSGFVGKVNDISSEFDLAIENSRSTSSLHKKLCDLVCDEIEKAADGCITVTEYVQKNMSKQLVSVFVGSHWVFAKSQQFYDLVRDAANKAGLPSSFSKDPKLMNQMFEQLAFRVSRYREQAIPKSEVWINLQNGTLEVNSKGRIYFREHRKDDFFTYVLPYDYNPVAACPQFEKFLNRVLPDASLQAILGEFAGYCFTRDLRLEKCLILVGPGGNGKSVVSDVLIGLFGDVNVSKVDWELMTSNENYRSACVGKLANISQENGQNIKHSILKNMITGESVMVKHLYKDPEPTTDYGKLIALFNTLPKTESTNAYVRRLLILPFNEIITDEEKDVQLTTKLMQELSGILNWVLAHLQRLILQKTFTKSAACEETIQTYMRDQNSALRYFDERCVTDPDGRVTLKDLFADYKIFCNDEGIRNPFGRNNFLKQLEARGVVLNRSMSSNFLNVKFKQQ